MTKVFSNIILTTVALLALAAVFSLCVTPAFVANAQVSADCDMDCDFNSDTVLDASNDSYTSVGKAAFMMDYATGTVLYQRNQLAHHPIASMVKIMTATLTFEAIDRGDISLDSEVTVSREAASMGGSQVFLDEGSVHKVGDLLKTVIVASANDSCVALAEHIAGSVPAFVDRMNARAAELGMTNTNFKNCTGLPAAESYSCARDSAIMFSELIKHQKYFEYASIWLEDYKHPSGRTTEISNTNKLVRFYSGCDGGKTGFTNEAKFCLTATAQKNGMRVIAVMIGADSSKSRNAAVSAMFDYAFANFKNEILLDDGALLDNRLDVSGGKQGSIALKAGGRLAAFMAIGEQSGYQLKLDLPSTIKAPVMQNDVVGKAYLVKDGEVVNQIDILSAESVSRMSLFDAITQIGSHW